MKSKQSFAYQSTEPIVTFIDQYKQFSIGFHSCFERQAENLQMISWEKYKSKVIWYAVNEELLSYQDIRWYLKFETGNETYPQLSL